MKLYTRCSKCREFINFNEGVSDRFKLAAKKGVKVELKCKNCNSTSNYHVNDIKAETNKKMSLIATLIFLGGTFALFIYLWDYLFRIADVFAISGLIGVLTIPFMVYQTITSEQENKVRNFNMYDYG